MEIWSSTRYDANGNVTNLIYPGNRTVSYSFDSLNRLTNVTDWANRQTVIAYDLAGRVTSITRPNGTVRAIKYHAASQATNIVEKLSNNFPIAFFRLNWDNAARVQWGFAAPLPHSNSRPVRTMTFDDDNRIVTLNGQSVVHDQDGNMTTGPLTNNTLATYTYDARNRLSAIGDLRYGYDPAGNRVAITNGTSVTKLVINPNGKLPQVLVRTNLSGGQTLYVYGPGLLYEVNFNGAGAEIDTRNYHYDYRGSTVAITDGNGNITDRIEYSAYGMTTYRAGSTDTPFLYNGRYGVMTDLNGLLYMQVRYYNPYICRFINPDPTGFAGGLNWYCYADGNPISMLDPFGLGAAEAGLLPSWLTCNNIAASVIPGQSAWNSAVAQFQGGNYGWAAICAGQTVAEQIMFALSLGASGGATPALNAVEGESSIVGQSFGKLGTVVESPSQAITGFTEHGFIQADVRGLTWDIMQGAVKQSSVVLQQSAGQYLYVSPNAAVVPNPAGQIMTTYPASMFGPDTQALLRAVGH